MVVQRRNHRLQQNNALQQQQTSITPTTTNNCTEINNFHYPINNLHNHNSAFNTPPLSTNRRYASNNMNAFDNNNEKQTIHNTTVIVVEDLECLNNTNSKPLENTNNSYGFPILQTIHSTTNSNLLRSSDKGFELIHYPPSNANTNTSPSSTASSSTATLRYDHITGGYLITSPELINPSSDSTYQIISSNNSNVVVSNNSSAVNNKIINHEFNYRQAIADAAATNNYVTYDNSAYPSYYPQV